MSSDDSKTQLLAARELSLAVKEQKSILPFCSSRLPYRWSPGNRSIAFFDLKENHTVEEYFPLDQIITVECGIKLAMLKQFLLPNKQWFPISYPDDQTTLLDLIVTGNSGALESFAGGLRRHILGLTFVLSNGTVAKTGGKVVKNVSGYDLTRFLIGSYGHFAVPLKANLRLRSSPEQLITVVCHSSELVSLYKTAQTILNRQISLTCLDLFDRRLVDSSLYGLYVYFGGSGEPARHHLDAVVPYSLCMQVYGDSVTIEAELSIINQVLNEAALKAEIVSEMSKQDELWTAIGQIDNCFAQHNYVVEMAIAASNFLRLCQNKQLISFPFLYRPESGRLVYCLQAIDDQNQLINLLDAWSKQDGQTLTVAFSDDQYMRKVVTLGIGSDEGLPIKQSIKRSLKEKFDPDNLFNPFVDFS